MSRAKNTIISTGDHWTAHSWMSWTIEVCGAWTSVWTIGTVWTAAG
jgi:hypothetical protein